MWAGAVLFASATCSLQFAEASAATLSQQEKNSSADVRREMVYISGFICAVHVSMCRWRLRHAEAMSHFATPQPHEVMAHISPRFSVIYTPLA
jgi:hypothetical protein